MRNKEQILDMWSTSSSGVIAKTVGVTRNTVIGVVNRARAKGDKRAIKKPSGQNDRVRAPVACSTIYWCSDDEKILKTRLEAGDTVECVAGILGRSEGSLRKKMTRLGLRAKVARQNGGGTFQAVSTPSQAAMSRSTHQSAIKRMEAEVSQEPKNIIDIGPGECRGPVGKAPAKPSDPPQMFCAAPVAEGSSWCAHHQERYCIPYMERKRRHRSDVKLMSKLA